MDAVGLRLEFIKQKWPDLLQMGRAGQLCACPGETAAHKAKQAAMHAMFSCPHRKRMMLYRSVRE